MLSKFGYNKIPNLASKKMYSNEKETVKYRQASLQDFINTVVSHETLSHSPELVDFLKVLDSDFAKIKEVLAD